MPGKHGFGDTRKKSSQSPVYKKQKFGEAAPFKMKSGNSPLKKNGIKKFLGMVKKDPMIVPKTFVQSIKKVGTDIYKKVKAKKGPY